MKKRRAKFGDVIEVSTPNGFSYLQYVSRHPAYGDVIRVLPGLFQTRPNLEELVREKGYFTFYPLRLAVSRGMVDIVENISIPAGSEGPGTLRRAGAMSNDGRVLTWVIGGAGGDYVREELSSEEKKLPIAEIWNHEMLIHQLARKWSPEQEG
jgi:hypothetical protein